MDKATFFCGMLREAYLLASNAKECCSDNPDLKLAEDKTSALSFAAACTAKYSAAAAIYWSSPELFDEDVPALLAQFDIFTREIRNDYRNDHSRQWVGLEFDRLADLFAASKYQFDEL